MRKPLTIFAISVLVLLLFRGSIYRTLIKYKEIETRSQILLHNKTIIKKIETKNSENTTDIQNLIQIATEITNKNLQFTFDKALNDPNELIETKSANCVGYSAMFNSTANYLIQKHGLQNAIKAEHKVAHLHFLGINIHQYNNSPFFKDHDYNEITNLTTGEVISIDPSVSDYLWINSVGTKNIN